MIELLYYYLNTVECHYDTVQYNMILHISLEWLRQNTNQNLNTQNTPHTSPMGCLLSGIWRKLTALYITAPHCMFSQARELPTIHLVAVVNPGIPMEWPGLISPAYFKVRKCCTSRPPSITAASLTSWGWRREARTRSCWELLEPWMGQVRQWYQIIGNETVCSTVCFG